MIFCICMCPYVLASVIKSWVLILKTRCPQCPCTLQHICKVGQRKQRKSVFIYVYTQSQSTSRKCCVLQGGSEHRGGQLSAGDIGRWMERTKKREKRRYSAVLPTRHTALHGCMYNRTNRRKERREQSKKRRRREGKDEEMGFSAIFSQPLYPLDDRTGG